LTAAELTGHEPFVVGGARRDPSSQRGTCL